MKKNTQKLLLSLYSSIDSLPSTLRTKDESLINRKFEGITESKSLESARIKISNISHLTPDLSDGGRRSLLHVLKKGGLINSERVLGTTSIGITQHGIKAIEDHFPALSSRWDDWLGDWDCIVFVKAPKSDKQFRYLRTLLVNEGFISISRGVFISPFSAPSKVLQECNDLYRDSIMMFSVGKWKIASLRSFIIEKYGLIDVVEAYSGISNDVTRLLTSMNKDKRLMSRYKTELNLVFDRLIDVLNEDPGFCGYYFKESPKVKSIMLRLNLILSSI